MSSLGGNHFTVSSQFSFHSELSLWRERNERLRTSQPSDESGIKLSGPNTFLECAWNPFSGSMERVWFFLS